MTTPLQLANYLFPDATSVTPAPEGDPENFHTITGEPREDYANVYVDGTVHIVDGRYTIGLRPVLSQHGGMELDGNGSPLLIPVWNEIPDGHPWRPSSPAD